MRHLIIIAMMMCTLMCGVARGENATERVTNVEWYVGGDGRMLVTVEDDVISMTEVFPGDVGGGVMIRHLEGDVYEVTRDDNETYGKRAEMRELGGVKYLLFYDEDGNLVNSAQDRNFALKHRYSGFYQGKAKTYWLDYKTDRCRGFESGKYEIKGYMEEEEWTYVVEVKVGSQTLNCISGELKDASGKIVDVLEKGFTTQCERYPFTATDIVNGTDLMEYTVEELKIMRNEIFARHGYIFKTAAMKGHFEAQDWYEPTRANVDDLTTEIEKMNVKTIMRVEKYKASFAREEPVKEEPRKEVAKTSDEWTAEEMVRANTAAYADMQDVDKEIIKLCNLARMDGEKFWNTYCLSYVGDKRTNNIKSLEADLKKVKGLNVLYPDAGLCKACKAHCKDMNEKNFFAHQSSNGKGTFDRIESYYKGFANAENICAGNEKAIDIVMEWLIDDGIESLGHRKNILNDKSKAVGVYTGPHPEYRVCTTQDFGHEVVEEM